MQVRTSLIALSFFASLCVKTAVAGPLEDAEAAYNRGDYAKTFEILRPLAEQGEVVAQRHVGLFYALGQGVAKNPSEALKWDYGDWEQGLANQHQGQRPAIEAASQAEDMTAPRAKHLKPSKQKHPCQKGAVQT